MRERWEETRLGDVAVVGAGNSAPQDEALFEDGHVPFFRTADAGRVRFGDLSEATDYLNERGVKGLRRFPPGTILLPKSGASTFLNHRVILGVEGCVSSHLATIVPDAGKANERFLLYFLSTIAAQDLVQDHAYPSLNLPLIEGIEVRLPPLLEQRRIVGVLDEAFSGIAVAKANAERNLHNTRALFESHLQCGFSRRGKGWVDRRLVEVAESISTGPFGTMLHKADYVRDGIPLVNPMNIVNSRIVPSSRMMVSKETQRRLSTYVLKVGDVVIARRGELGRCALVTKREAGWLCGTGSFFVRLSEQMDGEFFVALFGSEQFKARLDASSVGTTMSSLNHKILEDLSLPVPPIAEQRKIMTASRTIAAEVNHLTGLYEQKLAALEALKKSLLHQAFAGEL